MAPGTLSALRALTDPEKRPLLPRTPLSREVAEAQPSEAFQLDSIEFLTCLRKDDIGPLVQNEGASDLLCTVASLLAVGQVPDSILQALQLGRMTALSKPDGRVRGIVVGDIFRRLVARTIAKQVAEKVEAATASFQHTPTTKAGCECVAHIFQTLTDLDPETTIMSVDGGRNAMLEGLQDGRSGCNDPIGKNIETFSVDKHALARPSCVFSGVVLAKWSFSSGNTTLRLFMFNKLSVPSNLDPFPTAHHGQQHLTPLFFSSTAQKNLFRCQCNHLRLPRRLWSFLQ